MTTSGAAAARLFAERGFAQTTIDDIVQAADVSRRTFFRYYSSKEDLRQADTADLLPAMLDTLHDRPADEPPLLSILAALRVLFGARSSTGLLTGLADQPAGPRARLGFLGLLAQWEAGIADTLLVRWGHDPDHAAAEARLRAVVTACAATSALRASAQTYRARHQGRRGRPGEFLALVEQAFATLADGCPAPPPAEAPRGDGRL